MAKAKKQPDHDQNFKNLFLEYPRETIEFLLPDEARKLRPGTKITPLTQQLLKGRLDRQFFELDVAFLIENPDGSGKRSREMLVINIEHHSKRMKSNPFRQAIYCLQLSLMLKTTRVIPVTVYTHNKRAAVDRARLANGEKVYLDFHTETVILGALEAAKYRRSRNVVERLCTVLMHFRDHEKFRIYADAFKGLMNLEKNNERFVKFGGFMLKYMRMTDVEEIALYELVKERYSKENYMTLADVFERRGKFKGKSEGKAEMLMELLKDGVVTVPEARKRLRSLARNKHVSPTVERALKKLEK